MRRLLARGVIALILISGVFGKDFGAVRAQAESSANPHVKLQWIDAAGSVVDLDWKTRTRWIWKQVTDRSTGERSGSFIQISIELPQHLAIELPAGSHAQLLESDRKSVV